MRFIDTEAIEVITQMPNNEDVVIVGVEGSSTNSKFVYEMPLKIDLRAALENNITKLSIKLLKVPFMSTVQQNTMARLIESDAPVDINTAIDAYREDELIRFLNTDADLKISEFDLDFTNLLNNQIVGKFTNLSDEELFGTQPVIITEPQSNKNKYFNDLTIQLNKLPDSTPEIPFAVAIDKLYQMGVDPASAFFHSEDELSYIKSYGGLALESYYDKERGSNKEIFLKKSIRAAYLTAVNESFNQKQDEKSRKTPDSRLFKTYKINESLRFQDVTVKFKITQHQLAQIENGKLNIAVTAENFLGVLLDVRHSEYLPKINSHDIQYGEPDLELSTVRAGFNDDIPVLSVTNNSHKTIPIGVYAKITNECGSYYNSRFKDVGSANALILPGMSKKFKAVMGQPSTAGSLDKMVSSTEGSVLFRVTSIAKGMTSNTFYTSLHSSKPEVNHFAPLFCRITKTGIDIKVYNIPGTVDSISIVRRNISIGEKSFSPIKNRNSYYKKTGLINIEKLNNKKYVNLGQSSISSVVFKDNRAQNENVYEYKAVFHFDDSSSVMCLNSFIIEYLEVSNLVKISFGNMVVSDTGNVTFECLVGRQANIIDNLFQRISGFFAENTSATSNEALLTTFASQFDSLKSQLDKYIELEVLRYNTITGEMKIVSPSTTPGEGKFQVKFTEIDKGTALITDNIENSRETLFIYTVQPMLRPTYDLLTDIFKVLENISTSQQSQGAEGIDYTGLTTSLMDIANASLVQSSTTNKYFTRNAKRHGVIQSDSQYYEEASGDVMYYARTGDVVYNAYTSRSISIEIKSPVIKLVKSLPKGNSKLVQTLGSEYIDDNGNTKSTGNLITDIKSRQFANKFDRLVVLDFNIAGDVEMIDFLIIFSQKNGINYINGAVHTLENSHNVQFVDGSQKNYTGLVEYYIQPVYENKKLGEVTSLGSIVVGNNIGIN